MTHRLIRTSKDPLMSVFHIEGEPPTHLVVTSPLYTYGSDPHAIQFTACDCPKAAPDEHTEATPADPQA